MDKLDTNPQEKIDFLNAHTLTCDDCLTKLAKAYIQNFEPEKAIEVLMVHDYVPCDGGERGIADQ